jgi:hypothetical protein
VRNHFLGIDRMGRTQASCGFKRIIALHCHRLLVLRTKA